MKQKKEFDLGNFEVMTETSNGNLIGGFSAATGGSNGSALAARNTNCPITNNCNGGNCTKGCGTQ